MSSNLKVNSLVPATGTAIGIGTTGGTIDFRCPATFGGNVTIGGTLTYDEVINIDSIGIVTARSGLKVTGGQLDVGSNIKLGNAGVVTATSFSGSIAASNIDSGTVATARLGSGTANNTTYLRGDQTWATVSSGPGTGQQYVNLESLGSASNTGNNTFAGYLAGNSLNSADHSTFFGYQAGKAALNAGNNTFFGSNSGLLATGGDNSGFGQGTLETITSATSNVAVGRRALNTTTSSENVAIGADSLRYQSTGSKNVAVGRGAGEHLTTAGDSVAIGFEALRGTNTSNPVTGLQNVAIGAYAGDAMKDGSQNVLVGTNCGSAMVSSHWNVAIGKDCADQATGLGNVILGHDAGRATSGNYNVVLGKAAGDVGSFSGANNIIIGYNADPTAASTSNEITLGNSDITKLRIPGLNYYNVGGSIGVNEATPDFSGFGGNGGGIELDDVNTGFTAAKLSQSGTDFYLVAHSGAAYISTRTNKEIVVEKNSAEVARFTADGLKFPNGKGIDFSATANSSGTMSSELLADYEEGTFTPYIDREHNSPIIGYDAQDGYYTRIGRVVYFYAEVRINSYNGNGSYGNTFLRGLPFNAASRTSGRGNWDTVIYHSYYRDMTTTDGERDIAVVQHSSEKVVFYIQRSENSWTAPPAPDANDQFKIGGYYFV